MRARLLALAALIAGVVLTTYGWRTPWLAVAGADDRTALSAMTWMTHWTWFATTIIAGGIAIGMLAGIRRHYVPPPLLSFLLCAIAAAGLAIVVHGVKVLVSLDTVEARDPNGAYHLVDTKLSIAPWLTLAGFAVLVAAGIWLWRLAGARTRDSV
jgi:hypothetical protein